MKNIKPMHIPVLTALVLVFIVSGCSTTSKLEDGEILYNGMKLNVSPAAGDKAPGEMVSDMQKAVNVRPNNPWPFISPSLPKLLSQPNGILQGRMPSIF